MSDNKVYETSIRYFLNNECRIITFDDGMSFEDDNQWLCVKDMLNCLGKLDKNGNIPTYYANKVVEFLEDMGWRGCHKEVMTSSNSDSKFSKHTVKLDYVKLSCVPVLITQFKPSRGTDAYTIWVAYMQCVNNLLIENKALDRILLRQQGKDEALKHLQGTYLTEAQGAKITKCKNGSQFKSILKGMELVRFSEDNIVGYDETFFECTPKRVKIKVESINELVDIIADYKEKEGIEDFIKGPKKRSRKVQAHTGEVFSSVKEAEEWSGAKYIYKALRGKIKTSGVHPVTGEKLSWSYVQEQ